MHIKISLSPSHSIPTPGQPVPALTLQRRRRRRSFKSSHVVLPGSVELHDPQLSRGKDLCPEVGWREFNHMVTRSIQSAATCHHQQQQQPNTCNIGWVELVDMLLNNACVINMSLYNAAATCYHRHQQQRNTCNIGWFGLVDMLLNDACVINMSLYNAAAACHHRHVLYFCICTCSGQLSMFQMETRSGNTIIIIMITATLR